MANKPLFLRVSPHVSPLGWLSVIWYQTCSILRVSALQPWLKAQTDHRAPILLILFPSAMETLNINDGTTMQITRLPDIDDETWAEVKSYVEANPDAAKAMQNFAKNPDAMRGWLQTQAIAEHYNTKLANGDTPVQEKVKSLESDAELGPIFEEIKKNGLEAAMKYYQDLDFC